MTDRVVVVPGFGADPGRHWFPWFAKEAGTRGAEVSVVSLPDPLTPRRDAWETAVAGALGQPDQRTWVVGHSLGCVTALRVLDAVKGPWRLGGTLLVAGFSGPLAGLPELDEYLTAPAPARRVSDRIDRRVVFSSDADPVVPVAATMRLATDLRADLDVLTGRGHFTQETGVVELPEAIDVIFGRTGLTPGGSAPR
jgi:predicted alpha/beta hydrolase family esterase